MAKTWANTKKWAFGGSFGGQEPFFGPESCVSEIVRVDLVGVGTPKKSKRFENFIFFTPGPPTVAPD